LAHREEKLKREKERYWANPQKFQDYHKKHYKKNKEKINKYNREYAVKNKKEMRDWNKEYRMVNKTQIRATKRKKAYGLTQEQFDLMLDLCANKCQICGFEFDISGERSAFPHIDHSHKTGKVRGLLCQKCNLAIGLLKDSAEIIETAAAYIRRTQ
jgi:hypothetical protein